jgi:hypothetical protein
VDHERVEWRELSLSTTIVKSLHQASDKLTIAALVEILGRGESGGCEDTRVGDGLRAIYGSVLNHKVDRCIYLRNCHVAMIRHECCLPKGGRSVNPLAIYDHRPRIPHHRMDVLSCRVV